MSKEEIWIDVKGYKGIYVISSFGTFKSLDRLDKIGKKIKGKVYKGDICKNGYVSVSLCKDAQRVRIGLHRLVALHFIPNPNNYPVVLHKDDNPQNNSVSNLSWGTYKDNSIDTVKKGRRSNRRLVLDTQTGIFYETIRDAAFAGGLNYYSLGSKLSGRNINKNNTQFIFA